MYRKVDFDEELQELKKYRICAWMGHKLKFVIVTVENEEGEKYNRKYYFTERNEYSYFLKKLRRAMK